MKPYFSHDEIHEWHAALCEALESTDPGDADYNELTAALLQADGRLMEVVAQ